MRGVQGGGEVWKSVLGCKGRCGIGVGKCVRMWGKVWESVRDEREKVCWGVGGSEERSGERYGGCGGR